MDRINKIISTIICSKEPVTVDFIAQQLGVSNKTIRNDFLKIETFIKEKGLSLSKKPGVGISIEGPDDKKAALLGQPGISPAVVEPFSPEGRKNYILKRLFMGEESITIRELTDELYVSRVTVHNDLDEVERWLNGFKLRLLRKTNYGIEIVGEEENWRNAAASLIAANKESNELKALLYGDYSGRIDYKTLMKLKELVNIDYRQLERIVTNAESMLKFKFSEEAFISLVIHIAISINRLNHNKDIHLPNEILNGLKVKDEYHIAEIISNDIEKTFKVKLPDSEIGYILLHILGAKMQQNKADDLKNLKLVNSEESDLSILMSKEIISIAEKLLSMDFMSDRQLLNGLILHLRPTINRLKYGLSLRNPILGQIKENYPEIFGAAWITSVVFEKHLGVKISEEEIGYIALHLGAAVERQKKPLRALVVCTSGIGTSQLLAAKLERHFRQIEIKDIVSVISLKDSQLEDVDIIISTVPVEAEKPVLNVSPILTENDLKRLDNFINNISQKLNPKKKYCEIDNLFEEDLIEIDMVLSSREQVIEKMCSHLYRSGYVKSNFNFDLLNRENISSTEIGSGVAIPHGAPALVNVSKIAVTVLRKPVLWGSDFVDIIFMICIAEADAKKSRSIIRSLYNSIDTEGFLDSLRNSMNKSDIKKILDNTFGGVRDAYK
jgi:Transcriptional antiterminator